MKQLLVMLLLLCSASVSAQDVIVKKDGSTILSKVIEIGTSEIKYKKYSNQNGPTYTITKSEIQAINYENGEKETFTDVAPTQPQQPQQNFNYNNYASNQVAEGIAAGNRLQKEKLLASAKNWRIGGYVWLGLNLVGGLVVCGAVTKDKVDWWIPFSAALGSGLIGGCICGAIANNKEEAASSIASVPILKQEFNLGNSCLSADINLMNDKNRKDYALGLGINLNF